MDPRDTNAAGTNAERARRIFDAIWNERRPEVFDQLCAPDCLIHDPFRGTLDRTGFELLLTTASALEMQLFVDELVEAGDRIALRWSGECIVRGEPMLVTGLSLLRFRDGLLVEQWSAWDTPHFGELLGLVPHGTEAVLPFDRPSPPA
ncbi:ester cyclase [Vulgatibacter sp.]|uniref:ester cyclase n=1 Tax=Vulgatibacter sp. TaxID=1971226 RepID=UPI003566BB65